VLLAGELAVAVRVELAEILVVRRALRFLFREVALNIASAPPSDFPWLELPLDALSSAA
jgi:hypothetical protein